MTSTFKFYEFFCGGGMARAGLGSRWECAFANDFDPKKVSSYEANWGKGIIKLEDVSLIQTTQLPGHADLAWASFPCQDLSLAGMGAGLKGHRSGTFWPFWRLIKKLGKEQRAPKVVVLENVCGTITSHDGKDFTEICKALAREGYVFGAIVVDAVDFVPQSRPRLFFVGIKHDEGDFHLLTSKFPDGKWHSEALVKAYEKLDKATKNSWVWWSLPKPKARKKKLIDIIEENPSSVQWHSIAETKKLIQLMSAKNLEKLEAVKKRNEPTVGAIYKRTRIDVEGIKNQRAEIRFDDIAGCLRTPTGGSSRQTIMCVNGEEIKSRLLSSREAARLMGLKDSYKLPTNYNDAYHLIGDGLVVPVVNHIATTLIEPLLTNKAIKRKKAA